MLTVRHPRACPKERRYVLDLILGEFLGLEFQAEPADVSEVTIALAESPTGRALTMPDLFFSRAGTAWLGPASLPQEPLPTWDAAEFGRESPFLSPRVPVLYGRETGRASHLRRSGEGIELGIDIPGATFFMLTRYEEVVKPASDAWDRFPAAASLASRAGFLRRPIVDEYVELLARLIGELWPGLPQKTREYRLRVTCDVDLPWVVAGRSAPEVARSLAADIVYRRDPALFFRRLAVAAVAAAGGERARDRDPANAFDYLMDSCERIGSACEFYVIAGHSRPEDGSYEIEDPWIRELLRRIHSRGHVIGLHASLGSYLDGKRLASEFGRLRRVCEEMNIRQEEWGGRQHFARWKNPVTWRNWDRAGLHYDSSMLFTEEVGFRAGTAREHPVYDLERREPLRLRERPLIVMEATLLANMRMGHGAALDAIREMGAACRRYGSEFVLLWHNNNLAARRDRRLFEETLATLKP